MSWRKPSTAPRDGSYIRGLFKWRGRRAVALKAYYDTELVHGMVAPVPDDAPQWVKDAQARAVQDLKDDPTVFFAAETGDDQIPCAGRMKAWKPL